MPMVEPFSFRHYSSKGRVIQLCEVIKFEDVTTDSNQNSKNCNGNRNE